MNDTSLLNRRTRSLLLGLALLSPLVASCSGPSPTVAEGQLVGPSALEGQVVIRREVDPYNVAAAQSEADQICAARNRRAQFVTWENGVGRLPDAIYNCVPGTPGLDAAARR